MDSEIYDLLSAAIDGANDGASDGNREKLDQLVAHLAKGDDSQELLDFMALHLALSERVAPIRAFSAAELRAVMEVEQRFRASDSTYARSERNSTAGQEVASVKSPTHRLFGRWSGFAAGLAVSLLFVLPLAWEYWNAGQLAEQSTTTPTREPIREDSTSAIAARIVKKIDCVWDNDRWMVAAPVSFRKGERISLSSGLLVLEFESGAIVTLEGPATASATSTNSMGLYAGTMSASVPDRARGFTVQTSSGEIVDLGTEFGVKAAEDGSVETHVFKGEVITRLGKSRTQIPVQQVSLTAGKAQLVSATGTTTTAEALESRFPRMGFGLDTPIAEHPPVDRGLVLWLAADGRRQLDEQGKLMAWGDNPTQNNHSIEDAWQVHAAKRPTWSVDAINGKPGIRFGGKTVLVSEPIEMDSDLTCVAVFRLDGQLVPQGFQELSANPVRGDGPRPDLGLQLLNLYGPPHPVLQIDNDLSLSARVHLGRNPKTLKDMNIGVEFTEPIVDDAAHVVIYSFDSQAGVVRMYLDGEMVAEETEVPKFGTTYTPRYIGNHPYRALHGFPGDIGEVMLLDAALDPQESETLSNWLGEKYHIPIKPLGMQNQ